MIRLADLLAAGGQLVSPARAATCESFCYDLRLAQPGQLFVAVKTDCGDGRPVSDAARVGQRGRNVRRHGQHPPGASGLGALLAQRGLKIIGVTGSVGKTTTARVVTFDIAFDLSKFRNRARQQINLA